MPQAIPYLSFNGNCAEAMTFYASALQGKVLMMISNADLPEANKMAGAPGKLIIHANIELPDGGHLYAGDAMPHMTYEGIKGVSLTLDYGSVALAQRAFAALSEGGKVTMPMAPQFWADVSGMIVDKFGTSWIVNGPAKPV